MSAPRLLMLSLREGGTAAKALSQHRQDSGLLVRLVVCQEQCQVGGNK